MEVTQVAVVTREKKNRRDRFICVTAITFRAPSSSLDYARRHVAYPQLGGEIWVPRERSRYVRMHYGEWIYSNGDSHQRRPSCLFLARSHASNTDILRIRQGRKFSQYTVLIVAPSRVFVFSISAYVSIATTRDARLYVETPCDKTISGDSVRGFAPRADGRDLHLASADRPKENSEKGVIEFCAYLQLEWTEFLW